MISAIFLISFLKNKGASPNEYISWVRNTKNGLSYTERTDLLCYSIQYKPATFMALTELSGERNVDLKRIDSISNLYEGLEYFTLNIECTDKKSDILKEHQEGQIGYYSRLDYLTFGMREDMGLIEGNDTTICKLYHYERAYGMSPYATILLGFEKGKAAPALNDKKILLFSKLESNPQWIELLISKEALKNIPSIKN